MNLAAEKMLKATMSTPRKPQAYQDTPKNRTIRQKTTTAAIRMPTAAFQPIAWLSEVCMATIVAPARRLLFAQTG